MSREIVTAFDAAGIDIVWATCDVVGLPPVSVRPQEKGRQFSRLAAVNALPPRAFAQADPAGHRRLATTMYWPRWLVTPPSAAGLGVIVVRCRPAGGT